LGISGQLVFESIEIENIKHSRQESPYLVFIYSTALRHISTIMRSCQQAHCGQGPPSRFEHRDIESNADRGAASVSMSGEPPGPALCGMELGCRRVMQRFDWEIYVA
jgi:hypothetical protein